MYFSGSLSVLHSKFFNNPSFSVMQVHNYSTTSSKQSDKVELSHVDHHGNAHMIDVSHKATTKRQATATGNIILNPEAFRLIKDHQSSRKGDVLGVAQLAGIMAAKQTSSLVPLCHNIPLTSVEVTFSLLEEVYGVQACACVRCEGLTGCEMEAMTAVCVALLTVYDMTKSVSKDHVLSDITLTGKSGGKSGHFCK